MKILSHKNYKQLDCTKDEWAKAMSFYNRDTRGYLANRAAHCYIIIERQEGEIIVLHFFEDDEDPIPRAVGTIAWRNDEDEGTTYYNITDEGLVGYIDFVNVTISNLERD